MIYGKHFIKTQDQVDAEEDPLWTSLVRLEGHWMNGLPLPLLVIEQNHHHVG